jgi:hypothetical protein
MASLMPCLMHAHRKFAPAHSDNPERKEWKGFRRVENEVASNTGSWRRIYGVWCAGTGVRADEKAFGMPRAAVDGTGAVLAAGQGEAAGRLGLADFPPGLCLPRLLRVWVGLCGRAWHCCVAQGTYHCA